MSFLAVNPILKAIKIVLAQPTESNIFALANAASLTIKKESLKIEVVEHTTKKGKVIKGVVRTDLSYAEAKAIDEFTFKKEGGWFIREKHLGVDAQKESVEQASTVTPQNEPETVLQSDTLVNDEDNNIKGLERKFKPANKKYKNPEINLEPKESAKLLKKTLTKLFPDTKFSVSMSRGTAYGSVSVLWVDGASYDLVNVIAQHFRGKGFDGSSDSTHYLNAINEDGKIVSYGLGYVSISRTYSREFLEKLKDAQTLNMDNVTIVTESNYSYFKVSGADYDFVEAVLHKAKSKHSTGKYSFGVVPQAENKADIEPSNEQPKSGQVQNSHQELADTLKILGWKIEPLNNQEGDIFASKDMEVKYKDKLIKAKATLRKWLEIKSLLTAYADELVLKNDHKATIDTSQFWMLSPVEQKQIIIDLETALRSFLIANRERFSQADSQSPQVVTTQEPQPKTNQMPSLMQDATGLDPAIKDMVKEYYDLVHSTYINEKLADPTLENWERKEYQAVKKDNDERRNELEQHLNNVVSANGIDWKTYYNELVRTNKKEASNVPSTSNAMESDSGTGRNKQLSVENGNDDESAELGRMARPPVNGLDARGGSERNSGLSLSENDGIGIGARGDTVVSDRPKQRGARVGNTTAKSSRSSRTNEPRTPNERSRDSAIVRTSTRTGSVTQTAKEAEQLKADGTPTQWGDVANINKALPYLLPEQRDDVAKLEKRLIEDNKNGMLFTNGTGTGKAQPLTAKILTPNGWKAMGEISIGDDVISIDGKPTKVTGVYPQGEKKIYSIKFSDGSVTECCAEHLWLTQTLYERRKATANPDWNCAKPKVRNTEEIIATLEKQHFIPMASPIVMDERSYVISPYVLGVILGDGCITQNTITFSSVDNEIIDSVKELLPSDMSVRDIPSGDRCPQYRISMNEQLRNEKGQMLCHPWLFELKRLNLHGKNSSNKFIPDSYLHGSIEQRIALLQGLLDTDGCVDKKSKSPVFTSISSELARGVVSLVRSLGGIATTGNKKTSFTYKGEKKEGKPAYNVHINLPNGIYPFKLSRKAIDYQANTKYPPRRKIIAIEEVGIKEAQCISVEHSSRLYVTDDYIVTHNTFTGLGAVKRFANAGKKNILIVSMNDKIIRDFIKSALSLNLDIHQLDGVADNGKDRIVATTYANLAQNLTLGKRDWDLIVVDEAHNLMQGEKGENTNALAKLRALSGHHAGFHEWVKMRHAEKDPKPIGENPETGNPIYDQDEVSAWEQFKKPLREQWKKTWAEQPKGRTKVIFLTATPFSYVKTLDWAEGYLFDFVPPAKKFSNDTEAMGAAYNSGSEYERFYMSNFGYKMRTNRLTRPDGRVDVGILERKFAEKLKTEGAMSGRDLSVPFDYDRKFVLVNSEIGKVIDEGFKFLWETKDKDGKSKYSELLRVLNKRFDYLARLQLLEAIKAQEAIEQIKKHIALGRKVIVFHDYNEGGGSNPFVYVGNATQDEVGAVESQYEDFKRARPDLIALDLDLDAPITTLRRSFPDALLYNGRVAKGQRSKNADLFNTDSNGHNVLIAQSDAAATGISFHDTTGAHQRVIINIGMPSKPAKLRQTEGRIYRVGQASNAIQRYLTTGTDWERSAFAQKIAERAETVDNLAQGESASVSIKDALVRAYEEAEYFEPSKDDGVGGKAYDEENNRVMALSLFERAKTDYWVKQKITAKRGEREGKEWYATPEPVGLFMVNLAGAHSGDDILEPSAGDGAIGRYMPSDASVTFVEPSESLASRARMNNSNANVIVDNFESHGTNNKYDAIVMNPPFGQGGSIAIKHLVKAFEHLRDGGRVVALLPVGKMDELIVKYHEMGYFKDIYTVAEFALPSSTFKNAGTGVNTKIHVFERHNSKRDAPQGVISKNLSHYDDIEDLFGAIENISIKPRKPRIDEALAEYGIEIYPNRSKYIITGEGLNRKDITSTLFGAFIEKNKDGDVVDKYYRGLAYVNWLKDSQIPTMAQFNNGLSFNNLPIKYQQNTNKYNTWDGVGGMPDWLSTAINRYGAKLEHFAVEKPVYDAVGDNKPQAILTAMRQALDTPSDENIQTLAREAGLRIKPKSKTALTVEKLLNSPMLNADTILNGKEDITDAKKKGENYYKKLKQSPIVSPALGAEVLFDQRGWDYITNEGYAKQFDPKKKRSEDEVKQRIALLPKAREVIANATSIEGEPRTEHGSTRFALIGRFSDGEAVRVIVEKREDSDRYFLSVFDLAREAKQLRESPLSTSTLGGAPSVQDKATDASDEKNIAQPQANASGLFGDADTIEGQNNTANEYEIFLKHKNAIAMDIVKEIKRVEAIKAAARQKGKYSSAEHNRKKIAQKWGVNPVGWGVFDKMFGYALEVTVRGFFSGKSVKYTDQDIHDGAIRFINEWLASQNNRLDDTSHFDDIGGFNFTPAIDFDTTLKAIKTALTDSSEGNIKRLAMLTGLTIKQAEPDVELDMFGDPIQSHGFDLFGEPIQDGDDSPVEELPRLAVVELPLNKLKLSEDVPQFKSGADDESGVVEALGGKFDRTGVAPIQVWERTDGRLEIISGRHRTDLARRSGEKTIPAQVHKESEGFTAKQAMMLDAELNIRDGQGKVKDYVDYFTHSEISQDEADKRGLLARHIGQRAFTIASKGSEELKTLHRNEIISDQAAAEISNLAPSNSAMQAVGLRVLQEHKPLNNALNTIRAVMALTREKGQEPDTFDLFGFDDSALKEAEAMARIASRKQRQIAEQLNAIKGAVKNPKLAAKHGVVVENEADALAKVQAMTAQKARWDNWSSHADLLAEVRNELNNKLDSVFDEDDYYWLCQEELVA